MAIPRIVVDTNVLVAALRSRHGASHRLLNLLDSGKFTPIISVPLVLEYEDAAKRLVAEIGLTARAVDDIVDYICRVADKRAIFYLWRPFLRDPKDDMVLELAVNAGADSIVTYNHVGFQGAEEFGIRVVTAREFLRKIGELP